MEPLALLGALVVGAVVIGAIVSARLARQRWVGTDRVLDAASRERIARRVSEIPGPQPREGALAMARDNERGPGTRTIKSRRHLLRDASAVLTVLGGGGIAVLALTQVQAPMGSVLEVTATSRPGVVDMVPGAAIDASPGATPSPAEPRATDPASRATASRAPVAIDPTATQMPDPTVAPPTERQSAASARMAVLTPCSGQRTCYVYQVRPGDNLSSIANWFGVAYESVLAMNPRIRDPRNIHAGDRIRLPTPRR